ncbi:hypothetical protein CERSUDRAFT_110697 [Gelatoporia subvermispora B]|uniref:Seipin n=1 Tax=Ceriporiopsis subvermispora (strain B) TaxID=914234 RepID=M2PZ13_CERS8|nr:hypothetical protein CERSUDRAFT_110697 [Gelatoporia subvermispora B]
MSRTVAADDKTRLHRDITQNAYFWPVHYPLRKLADLVAACVRLFRPVGPQLVPLVVFLAAIPVIVFLSFTAGWIVWRSIAVGWETEVFLQYGDGMPPYAEVALPNLSPHQPYDISAHFVVPASESNLVLGNFMTSLTLLTPSNQTLASVRRSAIILPPSSPLSILYNRPGTVDIKIPLFRSFISGTTRLNAQVELGRRDQWKTIGNGQGREVSVISALLRGVVVHKGLRGLISRFPLISASAAAATFSWISFIVLASCMLPAIEWRFRDEAPTDDDMPAKPRRKPRRKISVGDLSEKSARRQKQPARSRSAGTRRQSSDMKEEPVEDDAAFRASPISGPGTSPSASSSTPLRRRRSRILARESDSDA